MILVWVKSFGNILIMCGTIQLPQMLLPRSWKGKQQWTVRCSAHPISSRYYSPNLPLWLWTWPQNPVLNLLDLSWSSRFLQPEQNCFNHLVTILWSTVPSSLAQMFLVASAALWPYSISSSISSLLHIHLWDFQITHGVKQCTTCQSSKYVDATNHSGYLSMASNYFSHRIYMP